MIHTCLRQYTPLSSDDLGKTGMKNVFQIQQSGTSNMTAGLHDKIHKSS